MNVKTMDQWHGGYFTSVDAHQETPFNQSSHLC